MIAEVFITPDVFTASEDVLRSRLVNLSSILLPQRITPRFVVCQLDSQKWQKAVGAKLVSIRSQELQSNAKAMFMHLIDQERGVCVNRPLDAGIELASESDWVCAAKTSSVRAAIDGIVSSDATRDQCMAVDEFCGDDFWGRYPNPRTVGRTLADQEPLLQTICFHSDWLLIRLPYVGGDDNDEIITLKQILRLAANRIEGQKKCSIYIHVASRPRRQGGDEKLKRDVEDQIVEYQAKLECLDIQVVSPNAILDRMLFAGEWASMPHQQRAKRVRWLLTMTHVAIGRSRDASTEPCTWSLFDRRSAHNRLKQIEEQLSSSVRASVSE
jgi:hypothetical protein